MSDPLSSPCRVKHHEFEPTGPSRRAGPSGSWAVRAPWRSTPWAAGSVRIRRGQSPGVGTYCSVRVRSDALGSVRSFLFLVVGQGMDVRTVSLVCHEVGCRIRTYDAWWVHGVTHR